MQEVSLGYNTDDTKLAFMCIKRFSFDMIYRRNLHKSVNVGKVFVHLQSANLLKK